MGPAVNDGPPGLTLAMPLPNPPPPRGPIRNPMPQMWKPCLQAILANTERHDKQFSKVCREQDELKETANKTLTTASQVKDDMESLIARLLPWSSRKHPHRRLQFPLDLMDPYSPKTVMTGVPYATTSRWNTLGGANGNLMVTGGFPNGPARKLCELLCRTKSSRSFPQITEA